jgi:hypothetical protein
MHRNFFKHSVLLCSSTMYFINQTYTGNAVSSQLIAVHEVVWTIANLSFSQFSYYFIHIDVCLLGCNAILTCRQIPYILPLSYGLQPWRWKQYTRCYIPGIQHRNLHGRKTLNLIVGLYILFTIRCELVVLNKNHCMVRLHKKTVRQPHDLRVSKSVLLKYCRCLGLSLPRITNLVDVISGVSQNGVRTHLYEEYG